MTPADAKQKLEREGAYWARWEGDFEWITERSIRRDVMSAVPVPRGVTLEVGAGSGMFTRHMDRSQCEAYHVVDLSAPLLERLKGYLPDVEVHVGPAEALPFPDDHFDDIYVFAAVHHFDLEPALKEIWRCLKPGGRFFCFEPNNDHFMRPAMFRIKNNLMFLLPKDFYTEDEQFLHVRQLAEVLGPLGAWDQHSSFLTVLNTLRHTKYLYPVSVFLKAVSLISRSRRVHAWFMYSCRKPRR